MKRLWVVGAAVFIASTSLLSGASAQQVPCGSGGTSLCGFDRVQDLGNKREGESFTINNNFGFMPGGPATKTFNGSSLPGFNFPANGTPITTVRIVDDGIGTPTALGAIRPLFAVVGLNLAQATRTPRVEIDGIAFTANALGVRNAIVIQGQAADTGPGRWTNYFTIVPPAGGQVGATGLGRTGSMILRWSMLGAALLAVGALLVLSSRRRRHA